MGEVSEVFHRYEKKFLIDYEQYQKIAYLIAHCMDKDSYCENGYYDIYNIYYDTPDNYLIRTSLSKPSYKEKFRIRRYSTGNELGFLEIKKKYLGLTNKRRTKIDLSVLNNCLYTNTLPTYYPVMNKQVLTEIDELFKRYQSLKPMVALSYTREAWHSKIPGDSLRITFDFDIMARRQDLYLGRNKEKDVPVFFDGEIVMEIKVGGSFPVWLTKALANYGVYSRSVSKYGTEYRNFISGKYNYPENSHFEKEYKHA